MSVKSFIQVSTETTKLAEIARQYPEGITGWNVWKLQFNLSFRSWQFMQIRISLIPALGLNDDSLMGMSSLLRVTCDDGSACGTGNTQ